MINTDSSENSSKKSSKKSFKKLNLEENLDIDELKKLECDNEYEEDNSDNVSELSDETDSDDE